MVSRRSTTINLLVLQIMLAIVFHISKRTSLTGCQAALHCRRRHHQISSAHVRIRISRTDQSDPLLTLKRTTQRGSKRNGLLCQNS
ncbi:MAG: hypothetical protein NXY57DRAFT_439695 [Lentinula lateritia]|nr:MAG: hypothetical protein NXY57DRAFT_439695 [Lentinula lateritia]